MSAKITVRTVTKRYGLKGNACIQLAFCSVVLESPGLKRGLLINRCDGCYHSSDSPNRAKASSMAV